jgi:hypothetical protein
VKPVVFFPHFHVVNYIILCNQLHNFMLYSARPCNNYDQMRPFQNTSFVQSLRTILMLVPGRGKNGSVFLYKGKAVSDIRAGLQKGCKDAGISMAEKLKMALQSMTCGTRRKRLHERRVLIIMSGWLYSVSRIAMIWT